MCPSRKKALILQIAFSFFFLTIQSVFTSSTYDFVVKEASYTRLCSTKNILTVNGEFPGPTIRARQGDTITVNAHNKGRYNVTLHWHGVNQPRNPWSDGPEYITQCPIKPGGRFRQKVILSTEVGTLWWHAHSDWLRATVHGAIIIYPKVETSYPFPKPHADIPIILGEWWKSDVSEVFNEFLRNGGDPNVSDAITVNGQPGNLYACSKSETFRLSVQFGKIYLLRLVNAAMNIILFFSVAQHKLTVVGMDGRYLKHFTRDYIAISPGQTMDVLLYANQNPNQYYMASRAYSVGVVPPFDNTTATAILQYVEDHEPDSSSSSLPYLPNHNDTVAAFSFFTSLRSLDSKEYPIEVPLTVSNHMISTLTINTLPCAAGKLCAGPNGTRLGASMSNISFIKPKQVDILEAYYYNIKGVYSERFPNFSPLRFNLTAGPLVQEFLIPEHGTKVKVLPFGSVVELVFLGSSFFGGIEHPMHLHGFSFYVVGYGIGNFDKHKDPLEYNLIDPPLMNTVTVPRNGWVAIRFNASNPGVWFMHCHFERHLAWGMETVFIVRNGKGPNARVLPPPRDMPPC